MHAPILAFVLTVFVASDAHADDCVVAAQPAAGAVADLDGALAQAGSKSGWGRDLLQGLNNLGDRISEQVQEVRDRFAPNDEERRALESIHALLAPDKLGGADRTFNQNDLDRIVESLLRDPAVHRQIREGIAQEAARRADEAPRMLRGLAQRIACNRITPGTRAYARHYGNYWAQGTAEARGRIRDEITQSLEAEGIAPREGQGQSGTQRTLTLGDLESFQEAVGVMQAYGERVGGGSGGMRTTLPLGLSQEDIQAILDGRLPPNAVMVRATAGGR